MKRISIIGCGWLGYPLALFLKEKSYLVKGSSRNADKLDSLQANGIEAYQIQVNDQLEGDNIPAFFQSDTLLINIPPGRRNPNVEIDHPNQIKAIIKAAKAGSIQNVLFVSSTSVYGNENRVVTEQDALRPVRNSGKALLQIETFLQAQTDLNVTIVRMAGLVGGDRKAGRFFAGKRDVADGGAPINMVHRTDCIQVIHEIIQQEKWNDTFNVCADKHPTRHAFYQAQAQKDGFETPHFADMETGGFKIISNKKVKKALNYTFSYPDPMAF